MAQVAREIDLAAEDPTTSPASPLYLACISRTQVVREIDLAVEELRHAFMHRLETTPDGACLMVTLALTLS